MPRTCLRDSQSKRASSLSGASCHLVCGSSGSSGAVEAGIKPQPPVWQTSQTTGNANEASSIKTTILVQIFCRVVTICGTDRPYWAVVPISIKKQTANA